MLIHIYGAAFVAGFALVAWTSRTAPVEHWLPAAVIYLFIAFGLWARRRWTESAIFGAALCTTVGWVTAVGTIAWKDWPYSTAVESVASLVPGAVTCGFWFLMWRLVRAFFETAKPHQGPWG